VSQLEKFEKIDYFSDPSLVEDPYPYFDYLRSQGPVTRLPVHGVVAVLGYDEAVAVYKDTDTFSSCNSVVGPFFPFPVRLEGDGSSCGASPTASSTSSSATAAASSSRSTPSPSRCS
jgi:hypothetical protein